ncbi:unnamed protein product, partial [Discosporangium mesarthrocarpum]
LLFFFLFYFFLFFCPFLLSYSSSVLFCSPSLELALLSVSLNFLLFSVYLDDIMGQIFTLFILCIAACESSIG